METESFMQGWYRTIAHGRAYYARTATESILLALACVCEYYDKPRAPARSDEDADHHRAS
jgi:hypothetical protein